MSGASTALGADSSTLVSSNAHLLDGGYSDYGFGSTPAFGVTLNVCLMLDCTRPYREKATKRETDHPTFPGFTTFQHVLACIRLREEPPCIIGP